MTILKNTFEGFANTTAITATTSGTFEDNFDVLSLGTGAAFVYSTDAGAMAHGKAAGKITGAGANIAAQFGFSTLGNLSTVTQRFYVRFTALPTVSECTFSQWRSATANLSDLRLKTDGTVVLYAPAGASGTQLSYTSSAALAVGTTYRVERSVKIASGTSGSVSVDVYLGDSTTSLFHLGASGIDTGTALVDGVRFGKITTAASWSGSIYFDDLAVSTGTTTYLGPYVPAGPSVTASVSKSTSGSTTTVTLKAVASTYDFATPTFLWAQTAGPTVTLSSATAATASFTATAAGTYSFTVTASDDLGNQSTYPVSTTITSTSSSSPSIGSITVTGSSFVAVVPVTATVGGALSLTVSPAGPTVRAISSGFIVTGALPASATTYTVTASEVGATDPSTSSFVAPPVPPSNGGSTGSVLILVATGNASAGGTFV